ncbi:hypothetical protein V6N13_106754 [Hibiscus sabdariffa]
MLHDKALISPFFGILCPLILPHNLARWSYLLEIFTEVHPWSDSFKIPERVVWVELVGTPLHCWNHHTFKRIAEIWGELIFLGENASQLHGLEKMTMVLSTSHWERIETVFEIEMGENQFPVRISEISPPEENLIVAHKLKKGKPNCA